MTQANLVDVPSATCDDCRWNCSSASDAVEEIARHASQHAHKTRHWTHLHVNVYESESMKKVNYYAWNFTPDNDVAEFMAARETVAHG